MKNLQKSLELAQCIFFDLKDLLNNENCNKKLTSFQEFKNLEDFIEEQIARIEELEIRLLEEVKQ